VLPDYRGGGLGSHLLERLGGLGVDTPLIAGLACRSARRG
jgi:hypothetical protein